MRAAQVERYGEPVAITVQDNIPDPVPGDDEVLVRVEASGVNFHDLNVAANRFGQNHPLPHVPGSEVIGRLADGSRVAALVVDGGGFGELVAARRSRVYPVPEDVSDLDALAMIIQGNTAYHALHTLGGLRTGDTVLVLAGAGGVGTLAIQLARIAGAGTVMATASTASKRSLVADLGADEVLDSRTGDLAAELSRRTGGRGVDLVLDSVGADTFDDALASLAPLGRIVSIGQPAAPPTPVQPRALAPRNATVAGFYLGTFPDEPLRESTAELFGLCAAGRLTVQEGRRYDLRSAADAINAVRDRDQVGKHVVRVA